MSSAANGRAGEQYQVKAQYQVRANALLWCIPHIVPEVAEREGARGDGEASEVGSLVYPYS